MLVSTPSGQSTRRRPTDRPRRTESARQVCAAPLRTAAGQLDERGDPGRRVRTEWSSHGTRTGPPSGPASSCTSMPAVSWCRRRRVRTRQRDVRGRLRSPVTVATRSAMMSGACPGDGPAADPQPQCSVDAGGELVDPDQPQLPGAADQREHGDPARRGRGLPGPAAAVIALRRCPRRPSGRAWSSRRRRPIGAVAVDPHGRACACRRGGCTGRPRRPEPRTGRAGASSRSSSRTGAVAVE